MGFRKTLVNCLGILGVSAVAASCGGDGGGGGGSPPGNGGGTPTNSTISNFAVSPLTGQSPLESRIQLNCGNSTNYQIQIQNSDGTITNETISRSSAIDVTRTFEEDSRIAATCSGSGNSATAYKNVDVTAPEPDPDPTNPAVTQTVSLTNSVDLSYSATLSDLDEATLNISRDGEQILTRNITSNSYNETFSNMEKGDYTFFLSGGGVDDSDDVNVPNYNPEWDPNCIDSNDLNFNEGEEANVNLSNCATEKNPEDRPVLITASSLDDKTNPIISEDNLKITNNPGETGDYTVQLSYGSVVGGQGSTDITGNIASDSIVISGQLQDNETDSGRPGFLRSYSLEKELLKEVETDDSGNFSINIPGTTEGYEIRARIWENDGWNSFVRKNVIGDGSQTDLVIKAVPYDGLAEAGVTPEEFVTFMGEIQFPNLRGWDLWGETDNPFQGIEIIDVNPITGDYFTLEEQNSTRDTMLANIGCYTGGVLTPENTTIQIDNETSDLNYTNDGSEITPNSGWGVIVPSQNTEGFSGITHLNYEGRQIIGARIRIHPDQADNVRVKVHEEGHVYIAPPNSLTHGHTFSISSEKSIMNGDFLTRSTPAKSDCKAGFGVYEPNYLVRDNEFSRYMGIDQGDILGLDW